MSKIIDSGEKTGLLLLSTRRPEYARSWLDHSVVSTLRVEATADGDIRRLVQARLGVDAIAGGTWRGR